MQGIYPHGPWLHVGKVSGRFTDGVSGIGLSELDGGNLPRLSVPNVLSPIGGFKPKGYLPMCVACELVNDSRCGSHDVVI